MFLLFPAILFAYLACRMIWPLRAGISVRIVLAAVLLLVCMKPLILWWAGGSAFNPELSRAALVVSAWITGVLILLLLVMVVIDLAVVAKYLLGLGSWKFARTVRQIPLPVRSPRGMAGIVVLASALAAWGTYEGMRVPDVVTRELVHPDIPRELDGLTVVQLTDIHASALQGRGQLQELVERVNALKPDLIVVTGDLSDGSVSQRGDGVAPLGELRAKYGVWACPGNHEYYSGYEAWRRRWEGLGLRWLENRNARIVARGKTIVLAGLADPVAPRMGESGPDVGKALSGVRADEFCLVLAHQPRLARSLAGTAADVQLAGHTHGGMMWGLDWVTARANNGFVRGWYEVIPDQGPPLRLFVSPGTHQWAGMITRIGIPAEITRFVLRSGSH